jgi:hypothetical protein
MSAGIAVFAYNRPNHLRTVLSQLKKNNLSHLYVFVDGPATESDQSKVDEVREIALDIDWCTTSLRLRDRNIGLANSIVRGIDEVFNDHNQIIVLEDDCVPAKNFISYMETCLNKYANNPRVMNVNGYSLPIDIPDTYPHDVYFTYRSSSWGWGTWHSSWESYERQPFSLEYLESNNKQIQEITQKAGGDLYPMMQRQLRGEIDSWAVWWSYAIVNQDGLCVNPVGSKIKNIGHDGTGTHSGESNRYHVTLDNTPVDEIEFPCEPYIVDKINSRYSQFFTSQKGIKQRLAGFLRNIGL